jgi:hypothetical protein
MHTRLQAAEQQAPEPGSPALLSLGGIALVASRRKHTN